MTTLLRKPVIFAASVAASVVLAFGVLCASPAAAMANSGNLSVADGAALSAQQDLSTQATVSIPVIKSISSKTTERIYSKDEVVTKTITFEYNKNGQVLSSNSTDKNSLGTTWSNILYTYNKKGEFVNYKLSYKSSDDEDDEGLTYTNKYVCDKKGRVKKVVKTFGSPVTYQYNSDGYVCKQTNEVSDKYTWNSKGQLQKIVNRSGTTEYTYDSKGNVVKRTDSDRVFKYKNTYSGNLLKKRVEKDGKGKVGYKTTYKYTTLKVPKSFANQVKAQQKLLKLMHMTSPTYYPPLCTMYK